MLLVNYWEYRDIFSIFASNKVLKETNLSPLKGKEKGYEKVSDLLYRGI